MQLQDSITLKELQQTYILFVSGAKPKVMNKLTMDPHWGRMSVTDINMWDTAVLTESSKKEITAL